MHTPQLRYTRDIDERSLVMLQLQHISKVYHTGNQEFHALKDLSIRFRENEFVSILGQSGSGKTTLLNIIGGLDQYTSGDLLIQGKSTKQFKDRDWDSYRNHTIGFVFQSYNLIGHQTALSNVEMAMTLSGVSKAERKKRAIEALERVGLKDHLYKKPNQMSGGQMQRIAITLLATIPINAVVSKMTNVENVAQLPWEAALILIGISIVLTMLAGLIPSRIAAKKDPVESLRSE